MPTLQVLAFSLLAAACAPDRLRLVGEPVPPPHGCDAATGAPLDASGLPDETLIESIHLCHEEAKGAAYADLVGSILRETSPHAGGELTLDELVLHGEEERILYINCLRSHGVPESCFLSDQAQP